MAVYVKGKDGTLVFEASAEVDHGNNIRFEAKSYLGKGVHVARTLTVEQGARTPRCPVSSGDESRRPASELTLQRPECVPPGLGT